MKPGHITSEFAVSVACIVVGLALSVAGLFMARDVAVASGAALSAIVAVGYAHSRGRVKWRPHLPPSGRV